MDATERAFLQSIADEDDAATPLVYADWLCEQGRDDEAELIRLMLRLDPDRDRYDDPTVNALRERVSPLIRTLRLAEQEWIGGLDEEMRYDVGVEWRHGVVEAIALPARWFVEHAEAFRNRYPSLRRLVLFCLDGAGEQVANCERLRGLKELELACWYSQGDAESLARSEHLAELRRLVLYSGGSQRQWATFASSESLPSLREMHLVTCGTDHEAWPTVVNEAAGRPIATLYDFEAELFPFAADFAGGYGFYIGKLPDGTQLFAYEREFVAEGWLFEADGKRRERFLFDFDAEVPLSAGGPSRDVGARPEHEGGVFDRRAQHLANAIGFRPAFIRVERFDIFDDGFCGPSRLRGGVEEAWGVPDSDEGSDVDGPGGCGELVYSWVRSGAFEFDFGNDWWCDRSGHVTST